jgi:hypothetical protein
MEMVSMSNQKLLSALRQSINGIKQEAGTFKRTQNTPYMMGFCDGTVDTCETLLEILEKMSKDRYLNS